MVRGITKREEIMKYQDNDYYFLRDHYRTDLKAGFVRFLILMACLGFWMLAILGIKSLFQ
jgi:hypothetical protein